MAGRVTMWGASQLLTCYFGITAEPPPSFWLALITQTAPTPYLDGTELDEPQVDDYARVEIPNDTLNWSNDSMPQVVYNTLPISFVTATSDWGYLGYWALCNAQVGGYNFLVGDLDTPLMISAGDQVVFAEGDINASLGPFFLVDENG